MNAAHAAKRFVAMFPEIYHRFYRRVPVTGYQPTSESLAVLRHLAGTGPLTVTEAATHFDRSQPAMSEMIQRLVDRGLLARMPDERDRRRVLVWLTEQGHAALRESQDVLSPALVKQAMQELSAQDRATLVRLLRSLVDTRTL